MARLTRITEPQTARKTEQQFTDAFIVRIEKAADALKCDCSRVIFLFGDRTFELVRTQADLNNVDLLSVRYGKSQRIASLFFDSYR